MTRTRETEDAQMVSRLMEHPFILPETWSRVGGLVVEDEHQYYARVLSLFTGVCRRVKRSLEVTEAGQVCLRVGHFEETFSEFARLDYRVRPREYHYNWFFDVESLEFKTWSNLVIRLEHHHGPNPDPPRDTECVPAIPGELYELGKCVAMACRCPFVVYDWQLR
jgi:hypothetical protein